MYEWHALVTNDNVSTVRDISLQVFFLQNIICLATISHRMVILCLKSTKYACIKIEVHSVLVDYGTRKWVLVIVGRRDSTIHRAYFYLYIVWGVPGISIKWNKSFWSSIVVVEVDVKAVFMPPSTWSSTTMATNCTVLFATPVIVFIIFREWLSVWLMQAEWIRWSNPWNA